MKLINDDFPGLIDESGRLPSAKVVYTAYGTVEPDLKPVVKDPALDQARKLRFRDGQLAHDGFLVLKPVEVGNEYDFTRFSPSNPAIQEESFGSDYFEGMGNHAIKNEQEKCLGVTKTTRSCILFAKTECWFYTRNARHRVCTVILIFLIKSILSNIFNTTLYFKVNLKNKL